MFIIIIIIIIILLLLIIIMIIMLIIIIIIIIITAYFIYCVDKSFCPSAHTCRLLWLPYEVVLHKCICVLY